MLFLRLWPWKSQYRTTSVSVISLGNMKTTDRWGELIVATVQSGWGWGQVNTLNSLSCSLGYPSSFCDVDTCIVLLGGAMPFFFCLSIYMPCLTFPPCSGCATHRERNPWAMSGNSCWGPCLLESSGNCPLSPHLDSAWAPPAAAQITAGYSITTQTAMKPHHSSHPLATF